MILNGFRLGLKERKKEATKIMSKVNYSEIDTSKLSTEQVFTKDVPGGGDKGKYSYMKVKHDFGGTKAYSFVVKAPQGTANFGIQMQTNENGKESYKVNYKPDDPVEAESFLESTQLLEQWAAKSFHENRIKMQYLEPTDDETFILRRMNKILYVPTDDLTGIRVPDSIPSKFLNLDTGWLNPRFRTKFERVVGEDEDGKPIMKPVPWELLMGMRVTIVPHIHFYRLCSSKGGQSFQCNLRSAIVVDIQKPEEKNAHEEEAKKLLANPEYLKRMEESIRLAQEMAAKRESLLMHPSESGTGAPESGTPLVNPMDAVKRVTSMGTTDSTTPDPIPTPTLESFVDVNTLTKSTEGHNLPTLPGMPGMPSFPT